MSLPAWLTPLPDAEQMRTLDRWAIEERGVPSLDLMARAGQQLATVADTIVPDGRVAVVCGSGNNGGDGYVAADHWRRHGRDVAVLAVGEPREGDARASAQRLGGDPATPFTAAALDGADLIVDALLGTGSNGAPRGAVAEAIAAINRSGAPVVAADIASGVDASTGEVPGEAVSAIATVTFASAKPGLWIAPGKGRCGRVEVVDIGIPRGWRLAAACGLIDADVVAGLPGRRRDHNKFDSGRVWIAGGSRGLTGAPCLAAAAAARAGAGYVTALVPGSLEPIFEARLLEQMTVALSDADGALDDRAAAQALERLDDGVLVLGPGLGRQGAEFALAVAAGTHLPLVLDADGLNAHAGRLEVLAGRAAPTVLTPHEGELARLLEVDVAAVRDRRLHHAREAARLAQAIVVLKGDDTLVALPDGRVAVNARSSPALATAGTGDVLAGAIGALLAAGRGVVDPFQAVCAAVLIHARAGELATRLAGHETGVIAGDVIERLPHARAEADRR